MKKNWLKTALSLMLLCPLAVGFSSCSEENSNHLEINGDFVKEGIEAEIDGKTDVLQITSNGNWKIEIPEDASHWVYIPETISLSTVLSDKNNDEASSYLSQLRDTPVERLCLSEKSVSYISWAYPFF